MFHIVLPVILLWGLHRLGYDRRGFLWQAIVALVVLPFSYLLSNSRENVNWVYGFGQNPQKIMPAPLFVILLMLLFPLVIYLPTHLLSPGSFAPQDDRPITTEVIGSG